MQHPLLISSQFPTITWSRFLIKIHIFTSSADPDQLASSEANWSGSTLFVKTGHVMFSKRRITCSRRLHMFLGQTIILFISAHSLSPQNKVTELLEASCSKIWFTFLGIAILRACGLRACRLRACGLRATGCQGMRAAGHRLPAIVYVKPKIYDQCYFSYYPPSPLPPTPVKKEKNNVQLLIPCAL